MVEHLRGTHEIIKLIKSVRGYQTNEDLVSAHRSRKLKISEQIQQAYGDLIRMDPRKATSKELDTKFNARLLNGQLRCQKRSSITTNSE